MLLLPQPLSHFSRVWLLLTLWAVARQAALSMEFSRQVHWSGLSGPPPGDLLDPGIKPLSLMSLVLAGRFLTTIATWEAQEAWELVTKSDHGVNSSLSCGESQHPPCLMKTPGKGDGYMTPELLWDNLSWSRSEKVSPCICCFSLPIVFTVINMPKCRIWGWHILPVFRQQKGETGNWQPCKSLGAVCRRLFSWPQE